MGKSDGQGEASLLRGGARLGRALDVIKSLNVATADFEASRAQIGNAAAVRAERRHLRRFRRDLIRKIPRVGLLGKINPTVDDERARAVVRDGDAVGRDAGAARERLNKRRLGRVVEGTDGSAREDQRRLRGASVGGREGPPINSIWRPS